MAARAVCISTCSPDTSKELSASVATKGSVKIATVYQEETFWDIAVTSVVISSFLAVKAWLAYFAIFQ